MVGKERGNKACLSQPASLPMVSGPISIAFQCLEHIFPVSAACAPATSFLCTPVTLQYHIFLSCKSTESGVLQLFHFVAASSPPFFDSLLSEESSFCFAVSTDPPVGVTQFRFYVLLPLSLAWVTNSERCP